MSKGGLIERARRSLARRFPIDRGGLEAETVFLAGTGRSGTTWASNIINYHRAYRTMFEPLHPVHVPSSAVFGWCKYLRATNDDEAYLGPARDIVSGKLRNPWVDGLNETVIGRGRLIKFIRGNLMLPWFLRHFPEVKIVMLVRHPAPVANSILKLGWPTSMDMYLEQPDLMADHLAPFENALRSVEDEFEKNVFAWCVQQLVPFRDLAPGQVHVLFYERLCQSPREEIAAVMDFLGRDYDDVVLQGLSQPSRVAQTDSAVVTGEDLVNAWRGKVSEERIHKTAEILEIFGLNRVYGSESMPLMQGDAVFEAFERVR